MTPPARPSRFFVPLLALALVAAAVVFVPVGAAADQPAPVEKKERPRIEIGMTAAQVRERIGEPLRIKKVDNEAGLPSEIWYYETTTKVGVHEEALSTRDVPYINPKTGIEQIIKEPVYSLVDDYVTETTALVMVDGHLTGSKRYRNRSQSY